MILLSRKTCMLEEEHNMPSLFSPSYKTSPDGFGTTAALDKHAPLVTFTPRKNYNPAISDSTKELMSRRDKAFSKAKLTKRDEDIKTFKLN